MIKISTLRLTVDGMEVSGEEPPSFLELEDSRIVTYNQPIYYKLNASLVNNGALVTGSISTVLICSCVRCLEEFNRKVENTEVCHFYENPLSPEIDLTPDLREDMVISFPQNYLCSEQCRGLCPSCGENLNTGKCKCNVDKKTTGVDNIWGELDNLHLDSS